MKLKFLSIFLLCLYAVDISAQTDKTIPNRALDGDLNLEVNDGGVQTKALTADGPTGNVGLGEEAPEAKLHISGASATGDQAHIRFENQTSAREWRIGAGVAGVTNDGFSFFDLIAGENRFNIRNDGQLDLTPSHRGFTVNGNDATIADSATLTVSTDGLGAPGVTAFVMVEAARSASAQNSTGTFWFFNSRGGSVSSVNLATQSLGTGCSHTFSVGSLNEVIITNTQGENCNINATVMWLQGY